MICRFIVINNCWQCTHVGYDEATTIKQEVFKSDKIAWLNCTKRPPRGFCKRPHNYL